MKTVREILVEAKERIEPEGRWTQGSQARDVDGAAVTPKSVHAAKWCMIGSIQASIPYDAGEEYMNTLSTLAAYLPILAFPSDCEASIEIFNDRPWRGQFDVLNVFDKAIAGLDKEGVCTECGSLNSHALSCRMRIENRP